jgi:flagellar hook assembly protein FlgD
VSERLIAQIDSSSSTAKSFKPILTVSPDRRRVAYWAQTGNKWSVVVDGKEEKPYDSAGSPIFSPDSQRVAYRAQMGNKHFVVVDGKEGKQYDSLSIGAMEKTRIIFDSSDSLHYLAREGNNIYLVEERIK